MSYLLCLKNSHEWSQTPFFTTFFFSVQLNEMTRENQICRIIDTNLRLYGHRGAHTDVNTDTEEAVESVRKSGFNLEKM